MKMIGNVGRKFRTAYMKKSRPKTGWESPIGDELRSALVAKKDRDLIRSRGIAGFPKEMDLQDQMTGNQMKTHHKRAAQALSAWTKKKSQSR